MEERFVDSDRESPGTHADHPMSSLSSPGGGQPSPSLCPADPAPAHPPCGASAGFPLADQVYQGAGAIFQRLRNDRPTTQLLHYGKKVTTPLPEGLDKSRLRQAYQLAFNTLKYQDLLENIIIDSCFHTSQQIVCVKSVKREVVKDANLRHHNADDLLPLAMVMLFDLQDRKFQLIKRPARKGEEPLQDVRDLEICFRRSKTKLAASLARCRVKQNLVSVSCVLPDLVRTNQNRAKLLPFYAWVNTLKSSVEEVCEVLRAELGLSEVERLGGCHGDLDFCRDPLCPDTLGFPPQLHTLIESSTLTTGHVLNVQHRGVCVAVNALRPHLFNYGDVLVAGSFSACTVAHIAVHVAARSGKVLVCGDDHTPSQTEEMQELLAQMDIKNVRVLPREFQHLDEWDTAAPRLKVIVLLPQCSSSALSDPVHALLTEHGDVEVLQDLSQGSVSQSKLDTLVHHQEKLLAHGLTFPKVQTVLYCTRSVYPQENEHLVKRVLEKTDTPSKLVPFRPRPLFPQTPGSERTDSRFFTIEPSGHTDGCFIARLSRESDAAKVESVQDVLARAAAKGLLGGIFGDQSKPSQRVKRKKSRVLAANQKFYSPLPGVAETEPVAGQSQDLDPFSGPIATDTLSMIGAGDEEEDGATDEEEEDAEEGTEGTTGGGRGAGKGLRKRKVKGGARRRTKAKAKVPAVPPNRTGKKVKPTHRRGPKKREARDRQQTPVSSFTPSPIPMSPMPRPATSTGQGRGAPVTPATHVLQMSHTKVQPGENARTIKAAKKVATPGSVAKATGGAGAADEEAPRDPPSPLDLVQPLVSSFSASSLSNQSASSQSMAPSSSPPMSSTLSSTPNSVTQTQTFF